MKKGLFSKKIWVIILVTTAILLAVGGTLAIYTSQVYQRAVVRNRYNDVVRFSSDKLYRVSKGTPAQKYYYPMAQGQTTMTFSVCNYDQEKNTLFSEKKIDYTITFNVTNGTADTYSVSRGDDSWSLPNTGTPPITGTLPGGQRSVDTYSVMIGDNDYGKVEIEVTVTPADSATSTQGRILNGILIPIEYATTQGVRVKSEFTDSTRDTPGKFDAYNLLVSISGGEGDVVIAWDHTMLDIDPFFVTTSNGKTGTAANGYTTLTVPMNSEDATGTYLISFYNHNTTKPTWKAWNELPISEPKLSGTNTGTSGS